MHRKIIIFYNTVLHVILIQLRNYVVPMNTIEFQPNKAIIEPAQKKKTVDLNLPSTGHCLLVDAKSFRISLGIGGSKGSGV